LEPERVKKILLTGATGYVGGRLLKALEERGLSVRCLARRPEFLARRAAQGTEIVQGDVLDLASLVAAMKGVDTAYYLVHSMGDAGDFQKQERLSAENFARAAKEAGVRRIVYLGGLGKGPGLSPHLASRQEVGRILRESGVTTAELRASIVIGSGSLSFELVRALVERLPVMVTPHWVRVKAQPIAIEDLIEFLLRAGDAEMEESRVFEVGGEDAVAYQDLMDEYCRQRGLKRFYIPVPLLTPRLSSLWLGLVTPLYARIGRKLFTSLVHPTVINEPGAAEFFGLRPMGMPDAIARAIVNEDRDYALTRWSDAVSSARGERSWGGVRFAARLVDHRSRRVKASPEAVFSALERLGGEDGWPAANFLWRVRGAIDLLLGGVGIRRGRPSRGYFLPGDALDFWRVQTVERGKRLTLMAEMKVPGRAWLDFEIEPDGDGVILNQSAIFDPLGLFGQIYWYSLFPMHEYIFNVMIESLMKNAEQVERKKPAAGTEAVG
jgi:uncharacterized protein YbjT (DUF2867 family)